MSVFESDFQRMYKTNGLTSDELRKRRRDDTVSIRKVKNEKIVDTRREIDNVTQPSPFISDEERCTIQFPSDAAAVDELLQSVQQRLLESGINWEAPSGSRSYGEALSRLGVLPKLTEMCLKNRSSAASQICLCILNCGKAQPSLPGAFDVLLESIICELDPTNPSSSPRSVVPIDVALAIMSSLGQFCNVANSVTFRLKLFTAPFLTTLTDLWNHYHQNNQFIEVWSEFVSKMCFDFEKSSQKGYNTDALWFIFMLMLTSTNQVVVGHGVRAVALVTENSGYYAFLANSGVLVKLISLIPSLRYTDYEFVLRAVANVIQCSSEYTGVLNDAGLLQNLLQLMKMRVFLFDVCFIIANICAERNQLEAVMNAGMLNELADVYDMANGQTRQEIIVIIFNISIPSNPAYLQALLDAGMMKCLSDSMTDRNADIDTILGTICRLLDYGELQKEQTGDDVNRVALGFETYNLPGRLHDLANNKRYFFLQCMSLIDQYFTEEESCEMDDDSSAIRTSVDDAIDSVVNQSYGGTIMQSLESRRPDTCPISMLGAAPPRI